MLQKIPIGWTLKKKPFLEICINLSESEFNNRVTKIKFPIRKTRLITRDSLLLFVCALRIRINISNTITLSRLQLAEWSIGIFVLAVLIF